MVRSAGEALLRLAENRQSTLRNVANTSFAHDTQAPNAWPEQPEEASVPTAGSIASARPSQLPPPAGAHVVPGHPTNEGPRSETADAWAWGTERRVGTPRQGGQRREPVDRGPGGGGIWRQRAWGPGLWVTVGLRLIPRPRPGSHSWAWSQDRTGQGRHRNGKRGLPAAGNLPGGRKGPHRAGSAPWTGGARASSSPLFKGKDGAMQIDAVERRLARFNRRRIYFEIAEAG